MNLASISELLYKNVEVITTIKMNIKSEDPRPAFLHIKNDLSVVEKRLVYKGYLKAFDPISKSTILCSIDKETVINNILIIGQIIDEINLALEPGAISPSKVEQVVQADTLRRQTGHPFFIHRTSIITKEELLERRDEILKWLGKNRIPAKMNQDELEIIIADSVKLRPPYENSTDYICPTRVVLKRIKQIVDNREKVKKES